MTVTHPHLLTRASRIAFTMLGGLILLAPNLADAQAGRHTPTPRPRRFAHRTPEAAPIAVLQRLLQAETSLVFEGTQITAVSRDGLDISSEQHVLRNGDQAFRIDYTRPERLAGESIVDNGKSYWHYRPKNNILEVGPSRVQRLRKRIHTVIEQAKRGAVTVTIQGQDTIASRPCTIIDVKSANGQPSPWRRLWVDAATGAQLKIEQYDATGQRRSSSFFTTIAISPSISADAFDAPGQNRHPQIKQLSADKPFRTVGEAEMKAGFSAHQPTYLPPGYRFQAASVGNFRGKSMIVLRYNNGISVISLFQVVDDGTIGPKFGGKRIGAITRAQGGRKLVLVGNISPSELSQVISSVQ
ncbi:MAG: sigma-E factor regulatory protein RseB domain-containing protein [Capsulimonas sp.]|uniref:LolA family protein n=1 Tax=Capsulimonas sp. TaxID=2494211 RepID=UPI003267CFEF